MAEHPPRDDNETTTATTSCPLCGRPFIPIRRQQFCSDRCRKTAWRRRHAPIPNLMPVGPSPPRRETTIYACPDCDTRYLAQQRCPDCHVFCRRVDIGGLCPHCDEPVTLTDLLGDTTRQEVHTMPG